MKKLLARTLFILLSLVIFLSAAEISLNVFYRTKQYDNNYLRFYFPISPLVEMGLYISDPVLFWRMKPGAREDWYMKEEEDVINSEGLRGVEFNRQKPGNVFRILCLGDSHVFGWGVGIKDTWPYKLEKILAKAYPGMGFEVINGGISGYSSYQILQFLKTEGQYYGADLVAISHDHHNADPAIFIADSSQKIAFPWIVKAHYYLVRFRTYRFLREIVFRIERRLFVRQAIPRVSKEEYTKNLLEIIRLAKLRNMPLIFIKSFYFKDDADINEQYSYIMRDIANKEGIPLVDLENTWESLNMKEYLLRDMSHPNAKGYNIIANEVYKSFIRNRLIKVN